MPHRAAPPSNDQSAALARALLDPAVLGHPVPHPEVIETHISCLALSGPYVYKLRKPVVFPFADFRSLEARRADCERELALNRRWAPGLYLGVVTIRGSLDAPRLNGAGAIIDYAVKMKQFPHQAQLDRVVEREGLSDALTDALADAVADLHERAPRAGIESPWATPEVIREEVEGNLDVLRSALDGERARQAFHELEDYSQERLANLDDTFRQRRREGRVRECHGDLHLANLAWIDGAVVPFDGVEFCDGFRWVDVASDLAFLLMDLHRFEAHAQATRVLNRWLELSGDFTALDVLGHYQVYRALVRAKVAQLRLTQLADTPTPDRRSAETLERERDDYLALALSLRRPCTTPAIVISHGLSGSGKSRLARGLAPLLGAVRVRSDVERRRILQGASDRYSRTSSERVYQRLLDVAERAVSAGYCIVVDAAFLERERRRVFHALAARLGCPFAIVHTHAPSEMLAARVQKRHAAGADASEADLQVLSAQRRSVQPLDAHEHALSVDVDTSTEAVACEVATRLRALLGAGPTA